MRLLYYAMGGGLGHLVRARAFLRTLGWQSEAIVLTGSEYADDVRIVDGLRLLRAPIELQHDPTAFRDWLLEQLVRLKVENLCVDAFPAGILGELSGLPALPGVRLWHVARLLRWENYAPLLGADPPRYERCWRLEPLHVVHQDFLDAHCERIDDLTLDDDDAIEQAPDTGPYWLIVHSGPTEEVAELVTYACEMREAEGVELPLRLACLCPPPALPAGVRHVDVYPAQGLFAGAQRIVSAAGFNVMWQARRHRARQFVLPMPRRFDDQYERSRRARRER